MEHRRTRKARRRSAISAVGTEAGTRFTKQAQPPDWNRVVGREVENHLRATEPAGNDWRYDLQVTSRKRA